MIIRYATARDVKKAYLLINQLASDTFTYKDFVVSYRYNLKMNHCLVAEEADELLGLGTLSILHPMHHSSKIAEVLELIVDKNIRGKGIGTKLLKRLTEIAITEKCTGIELASNQKRKEAHQFYEREGFKNTHFKLTKPLTPIFTEP